MHPSPPLERRKPRGFEGDAACAGPMKGSRLAPLLQHPAAVPAPCRSGASREVLKATPPGWARLKSRGWRRSYAAHLSVPTSPSCGSGPFGRRARPG